MSKFHIEGEWYLVPDDYSWNLARRMKTPQKKSEWAEMTYHRTPQDALNHYLWIKQLQAARKVEEGTLKDLVDLLTAENKRLSEQLKTAFSSICEIQIEETQHDRLNE